MARTSPEKAGAIDLLDRLYFNQILVHIVLRRSAPEAFMALKRITLKVKKAVCARGLTGARAENVKHNVYFILEIYLSDHIKLFQEHFEQLCDSQKDGLDFETVTKVTEHYQTFAAAIATVTGDKTGVLGDGTIASEIAGELLDELKGAPPIIRYRLSDRALAMEYPDAPLHTFAWLSKLGILPSAKFRSASAEPEHCAVHRAVNIAAFETMRTYLSSQFGSKEDVGVLRHLIGQLAKNVREELKEEVLNVAQAVQRRRMSPSISKGFIARPAAMDDSDAVAFFLAQCKVQSPYMRACLSKQSTALTDIAASMVSIRKRTTWFSKALYNEDGKTECISDDVASLLRKEGFTVNSRTIYRHFAEALPKHVHSADRYLRILQSAGIVLPAHYDDQFHYFQVTFER